MTSFDATFSRLDEIAEQFLRERNVAGMAVAVTNREQLLGVRTYGYADVSARQPITPDTLFEIGSIGKSFTAIALLQLQAEGKIDLHAPVTRYLPWFEVRSKFEPITLHHLLSHSAGIVSSPDITSDSRYDVYALRETETGSPPGSHYYYSNVSYRLLGFVLEEATGQSYAEAIRTRILNPLGMDATDPVITHATRHRLAVGYQSFYDDRPARPSHPLVPATWLETNTGDGCLASPAADLATYLRALLNRGQGLPSETGWGLLTQRVIEEDVPGWFYGYGLGAFEDKGFACLGHGGGMVGYSTGMQGDLDNGIGVCVLINQTNVYGVTNPLLRLFRATQRGDNLPPVPPPAAPTSVENADQFVGIYHSDDQTLELTTDGEHLFLHHRGERLALETRGDDSFFVPPPAPHPDFALFPLRFGRIERQVVEAYQGPSWYRSERYSGQTSFDPPGDWNAFVGHYRSNNPWRTNFRVVLRKGALWLIDPNGDETALVPLGDNRFRVGAEAHLPERLSFDSVVMGQALSANFDGCQYYRTFTP
jgi:D-alanyl-D-alanine carboxypeptidase